MQFIVRSVFVFLLLSLYVAPFQQCKNEGTGPRVLIFNKSEFYVHACMPAAVEALQQICRENGWQAEVTDDAEFFTEEKLRRYAAVVFLNTAGDVLNPTQEAEFERYIQAGGGFVGIHTAIDTEHNWKWYGDLVGGRFDGQTDVQDATLLVQDREHPATQHLEASWKRRDEWFNLRQLATDLKILITADENSYKGGLMGAVHPLAWYHDYDGGRAFFTALGHTPESYGEAAFLQHLRGGLQYAIGDNKTPLQFKERRKAAPVNTTGFVKTSVVCDLYEPMEMEMLPDGKILFIERRGTIKLYDPGAGTTTVKGELDVYIMNEEGLIGLALDPQWAQNHWIYLYYSPKEGKESLQLSRFVFQNDSFYRDSEKILLEIPTDRSVHNYHAGGCIEFDADGYLYLATGDNTDHYDDGYTSIDERPGKSQYDSQKSASNSMDLRGKILRIKPLPDGSYTCPAGNLFTEQDVTVAPGGQLLPDNPAWQGFVTPVPSGPHASIRLDFPTTTSHKSAGRGRPEIFVMGCRNPFRIAYDERRHLLMWGEPGPDAGVPDSLRGPEGYDEINIARTAGFYGWPYFVGNNKAYRDYDYATEKAGPYFDPQRPANNSPNNTGEQFLPPARPPLIWYPFKSSAEFPLVANGTRCAMGGPTYYCDKYPAETRFPDEYDGKFIIYDWMRNWMLAVALDSLDRFAGMIPLAESVRLARPVDMLIDKNGALWVLEYGTEWYSSNPDACLSRIDYVRGNGQPTQASANTAPSVRWDFGGKNRSFYQPGDQINYKVLVSDPEDGSTDDGRIAPDSVFIAIDYIAASPVPGKATRNFNAKRPQNKFARGKSLIDGSDCKACHAPDRQVNGPAYMAIASRYEKDNSAANALTKKIVKGGSGNWGDRVMSAHPQLAEKDVLEMVRWILSLSDPANRPLALQGTYSLAPKDPKQPAGGQFVLHAAYKDRGAGSQPPLEGSQTLVLRLPQQQAEAADSSSATVRTTRRPLNNGTAILRDLPPGAFLMFKQIDLHGIASVSLAIDLASAKYAGGGRLELHLGQPDGPAAGSVAIPAANTAGGLIELILPIDKASWPSDGSLRDVYFVVVLEGGAAAKPVLGVDWLRFGS